MRGRIRDWIDAKLLSLDGQDADLQRRAIEWVRLLRIYEGTSEIQKWITARELLKKAWGTRRKA